MEGGAGACEGAAAVKGQVGDEGEKGLGRQGLEVGGVVLQLLLLLLPRHGSNTRRRLCRRHSIIKTSSHNALHRGRRRRSPVRVVHACRGRR